MDKCQGGMGDLLISIFVSCFNKNSKMHEAEATGCPTTLIIAPSNNRRCGFEITFREWDRQWLCVGFELLMEKFLREPSLVESVSLVS